MPRNRFDKYLHINNNANQVPHKTCIWQAFFKVQPILDQCIFWRSNGKIQRKAWSSTRPWSQSSKVLKCEKQPKCLAGLSVISKFTRGRHKMVPLNRTCHIVLFMISLGTLRGKIMSCDNLSQALNLQKTCCRTTFTRVVQREQTGKTFEKNLQRTM